MPHLPLPFPPSLPIARGHPTHIARSVVQQMIQLTFQHIDDEHRKHEWLVLGMKDYELALQLAIAGSVLLFRNVVEALTGATEQDEDKDG